MTTCGASTESATTGWRALTTSHRVRVGAVEQMTNTDPIREAVPGLGEITWPRWRRLAHASRLLRAHRPDGPAVALRRTFPPISFPPRRCSECSEQWRCLYAGWAKRARIQEAWREWA